MKPLLPKVRQVWSHLDRDLWIMLPPSRRLRKLYRALSNLNQEIEATRARSFVPCHAPSDYVARRNALKPLEEARWELQDRIERLQNDR